MGTEPNKNETAVSFINRNDPQEPTEKNAGSDKQTHTNIDADFNGTRTP